MKSPNPYCLSAFLSVVLLAPHSFGSPLDTNPVITFSKTGFADPTLPANQDRITDDIWITRGNTQGIFNAAVETFQGSSSPTGTLWAVGTTDDLDSLTFKPWLQIAGLSGDLGGPLNQLGVDMVLHIPADNTYYDLRFSAWGAMSGAGGSFSYTRLRDPVTPIPEPSTLALVAGAFVAVVGWRRWAG
jgi:hypothetical protein